MSLSRKNVRRQEKSQKTRQTRKAYTLKSSGYKQYPLRLNKDVKPGDNFYSYVNQSWLERVTIPATKSAFGVSEEVEHRIDTKTQEIMEECIRVSEQEKSTSSYLESIQNMLGILARSVLDADSTSVNEQLVRNVLASIATINNKEEVAVVLGEFAVYKIRGVFNLFGQYENKNHTNYTYTIGIGKLGLPDPSYYFKKSLHRGKYYKSYKKFLHHLESLFAIPGLSCLLRLERVLAGVLLQTGYDTMEYEKTGTDLEKEFQYIPFAILFQTMGLENWKQRIFVVESMRWLHVLNKLFHHLGLDYWKFLLSLEFLLFSLPWLPPKYSNLTFQLYRKQLKGQQKPLERDQQAIYVLQQYATPFFSRLYVNTSVKSSIKEHATKMLLELMKFAEKRLDTVDWLEEKTQKKAQEKVRKMRYSVGYPDEFEHHTLPEIEPTTLLANLLTLGEWQTRYEIQKLGQPISQRKEWDDSVFVVNAYYYSQVNEMIIPAGILQEPFYDENASIAWNYGGLGCIICHEMTHAFDKEGKDYNPEGYQEKWWTATDNRNYNKKAEAVKELYGKQKVFGYPVSGSKTLSENIADIGGMGIALDALKHTLEDLPLTEEERRKQYREFFLSYAVSWRVKEKKKKRIQALILDKHAPPFLRVNLVVSQFQEWYDAFDVKKGDAFYIPPEQRIRIF